MSLEGGPPKARARLLLISESWPMKRAEARSLQQQQKHELFICTQKCGRGHLYSFTFVIFCWTQYGIIRGIHDMVERVFFGYFSHGTYL